MPPPNVPNWFCPGTILQARPGFGPEYIWIASTAVRNHALIAQVHMVITPYPLRVHMYPITGMFLSDLVNQYVQWVMNSTPQWTLTPMFVAHNPGMSDPRIDAMNRSILQDTRISDVSTELARRTLQNIAEAVGFGSNTEPPMGSDWVTDAELETLTTSELMVAIHQRQIRVVSPPRAARPGTLGGFILDVQQNGPAWQTTVQRSSGSALIFNHDEIREVRILPSIEDQPIQWFGDSDMYTEAEELREQVGLALVDPDYSIIVNSMEHPRVEIQPAITPGTVVALRENPDTPVGVVIQTETTFGSAMNTAQPEIIERVQIQMLGTEDTPFPAVVVADLQDFVPLGSVFEVFQNVGRTFNDTRDMLSEGLRQYLAEHPPTPPKPPPPTAYERLLRDDDD